MKLQEDDLFHTCTPQIVDKMKESNIKEVDAMHISIIHKHDEQDSITTEVRYEFLDAARNKIISALL